jgi:3-oxoacyl-[acyl-carrier protein] reductase
LAARKLDPQAVAMAATSSNASSHASSSDSGSHAEMQPTLWWSGGRQRIALVTGGGRGIGQGISMALAAAGAHVAVNYARDREAADVTVEAIRAAGGVADAFQGDVANAESCAALASAVTGALGAPDLVVHNGGVASRGRGVADTPADEVERLLRVHAIGPHMLTRELLPGMRSRVAAVGRADVVFISSVATVGLSANGAPYNMGKTAMEALAMTLAKEEVRHGIRVNIVAPGLTVSEMGRRLAKATTGVDIADLDERYPFGRVTRPEDVADAVLYLTKTDSTLTGQRLAVDGGSSVSR